jgi:Fe-S cluster biogenesis protein NfuA
MSDERPGERPGEREVALPLAIRAELSVADPGSCRFVVGRVVHAGGPYLFDSAAAAAGSPLAVRLFGLPGVASVVVADNVVTVGKAPAADWAVLKPAIGAAIRAQLASGIPAVLVAAGPADTARPDDAGIRARVEQLLEREVNRAIAAHGGRIRLVDVRDGDLYIAMEGGCQGCASSQVTLRQGFEVMVRRVVPGLGAIIDTTDHAAGRAPYRSG